MSEKQRPKKRLYRDGTVLLIAAFAVVFMLLAMPLALFEPFPYARATGTVLAGLGLLLMMAYVDIEDSLNGHGVHESPLLEKLDIFILLVFSLLIVPAIFIVVIAVRGVWLGL